MLIFSVFEIKRFCPVTYELIKNFKYTLVTNKEILIVNSKKFFLIKIRKIYKRKRTNV